MITVDGGFVLTYRNPHFSEVLMRVKIAKNFKIGHTFKTLYEALKEELGDLKFCKDDLSLQQRVALEDQLTFMRSHAPEWGVKPEELKC